MSNYNVHNEMIKDDTPLDEFLETPLEFSSKYDDVTAIPAEVDDDITINKKKIINDYYWFCYAVCYQ